VTDCQVQPLNRLLAEGGSLDEALKGAADGLIVETLARRRCQPLTGCADLDDETERAAASPPPLWGEGQGGGKSQTSIIGIPPTPSPSPHFGGAPPARRGGESAQRLACRARPNSGVPVGQFRLRPRGA